MVDVRVLFWSITNKIYWEKILPITLYVHKIALPENVTLTYTLSYVKCKVSQTQKEVTPHGQVKGVPRAAQRYHTPHFNM